jgi:hypothetical protein
MNTECLREQDVLDAVASGRWPRRSEPELRAHVAACPICQDVSAVFAAISTERDHAWETVSVPAASVVWWRAQIRAREEATRTVERPIAVIQAVAVACLATVAVVVIPMAWPSMKYTASVLNGAIDWAAPRAAAVSSAFALITGTGLPILPFVAASLLLAPILVYYALTEE